MSEIKIREEIAPEHASVDRIQQAAFGNPGEARLVRTLRLSVEPRLSLVAEFRNSLVGHIFFSPVSVEGEGTSPCVAGLAPLAVSPEVQNQGVGSKLIQAGLRACVPLGWHAVFVLGDPTYYSRFGFVLAAPLG